MTIEVPETPIGYREGDDEGSLIEEPVVREAHKRYKMAQEWESKSRVLFLHDLKFANGDPDNGYQWPGDIRRNRELDDRPSLTINKIRQHNLMIQNDAKQHKPSIKVRPVSGGSSFDSAEILNGLFRHIEYRSNAQVAYDVAVKFQVQAGIGYWRLRTRYAAEDTFNQEIIIDPVDDPLSVFIDTDIHTVDGSDARWAFIFDLIPRDEFERDHPNWKNFVGSSVLGNNEDWVSKDHVRVAEYFRKVEIDDMLIAFADPEQPAKRVSVLKSKLTKELARMLKKDPSYRERPTKRCEVQWFFIVGDRVAEKAIIPGQYIPIVRVIGEETIIDGILDRKGHTRAMKDPQRMYNYWTSAAAEFGALQGKTPWVAPAAAIEGYETYYATANRVNHAFLPYNEYDDEGNALSKPERAQPPVQADAYLKGMAIAQQEMMMVSGQHEPQMGEPGNERSAKAINERQRQGDNATYHFIDNLAIAIRLTGKIILSMIPTVYDAAQIMTILSESGESIEVKFDPAAAKAYQEKQIREGVASERIFNPMVGQYDVMADIGPNYATKREEAWNAYTLILTQAPQLAAVIGDILFQAGDFPMSDEAARRLKRMVPPQALGIGPTEKEQQLTQQLQQALGLLDEANKQKAIDDIKLKGRTELRDVQAFDAETKRIAALKDFLPMDEEGLKALVKGIVMEALGTSLDPLQDKIRQDEMGQSQGQAQGQPQDQGQPSASGGEPPVPGARQAPDGQWYVPDPNKPGGYMRVENGGQ